jgi:hypothetical protein
VSTQPRPDEDRAPKTAPKTAQKPRLGSQRSAETARPRRLDRDGSASACSAETARPAPARRDGSAETAQQSKVWQSELRDCVEGKAPSAVAGLGIQAGEDSAAATGLAATARQRQLSGHRRPATARRDSRLARWQTGSPGRRRRCGRNKVWSSQLGASGSGGDWLAGSARRRGGTAAERGERRQPGRHRSTEAPRQPPANGQHSAAARRDGRQAWRAKTARQPQVHGGTTAATGLRAALGSRVERRPPSVVSEDSPSRPRPPTTKRPAATGPRRRPGSHRLERAALGARAEGRPPSVVREDSPAATV